MSGLCFDCGSPATEDHHVVPRSMGGTKTVPLCHGCHGKIHGVRRLHTASLTKAALGRKRAAGLRAGNVPFGFKADAEGRLSEAPAEQAVISAVISARARGLSHRAIVAELAAAGLVSPRSGKPLAKRQVARILEAAAGS